MPPPSNPAKITRSGTSTPKATPSPVKSEMGRLQRSTVQPPLSLVDSLNTFAQSIMSSASLTVRRDLTKQQAVAQQREHDRQSKLKFTFLTLTETAETSMDDIEKTSVEIEKQIKSSSEAQSKNAAMLAAQFQKQSEVPEAQASATNRARLKDELADFKMELAKKEVGTTRDPGRLEGDLKAFGKKIDYLEREIREAVMPNELNKKLRGLATKDELRGLVAKDEIRGFVTKDELRHVTSDETRKHVTEALIPTEKKLASLTVEGASLNHRIEAVELFTHKQCETSEKNNLEQSSQIRRLDTSLKKSQRELELAIQEQNKTYAAVKVDMGAQDKVLTDIRKCIGPDPSNDVPSLYILVMRHSDQVADLRTDLKSLIDAEKLKDENLAQMAENLEEGVRKQQAELTLVQAMLKQSQQSSQALPNHPPTPPFASVSLSPRGSEQQRLQDFEIALRNLTQTTKDLEVFVISQQQKFDGLTSERVVQSMLQQMQQLYPQHPGNQQVWQSKVDKFLGVDLKDRLASIESQIAARVGSEPKIQEIRQFTADTRKNCSAAINSMKQDVKQDVEAIRSIQRDIEALKDTASNHRSQGPSGYGDRIDQLGHRISTIEAKYVRTVGDLRTTQADLARKVTHLEHQDTISPARATPGDVTFMESRSSKSVEPTGSTTISCEHTNDSDSSDTPLRERADRKVRRDSEDGRTANSNLKRKTADLDDEDEAESGEFRPTFAKRIPKRRHVSGQTPFS